MCDYYGQGRRIEFSGEFERKLTDLAAGLASAGTSLSEVEASVLREVGACLLEPKGKREICLKGLTPLGVEHLQAMLAKAGINAKYEPMRHHYRSASEPARLVLS